MDNSSTLEKNLNEQINYMSNLIDGDRLIEIANPNTGAVKTFNETLDFIGNSRQCFSSLKFISLLEDIIEMYLSHGKEATRQLIFSLGERFIDAILCAKNVVTKMELLRIFNLLLEECSVKVAQELLKGQRFSTKIENFCSLLSCSGDFEMQVMLIESILRLLPKKSHRETYLQNSFLNRELFSGFLRIRDKFFDVDCRKFLNQYNDIKSSSNHRIFSFPILNAKLDGEQLFQPDDEDYEDFWIDFNTNSKRITLFCQSTLLPSQLSQNKEPRWETLSLRAKDVKRYSCSAKDKLWMMTVELKENAQMLTNKEPEKLPHLFLCQISKIFDVETALSTTLKEEKVKASVPENSLFLEKKHRDPSESAEKSNLNTNNPVENKKDVPTSCSELPSSVQSFRSQKSSIPLEPMTIVTSSISSTSGSKKIPWQALHQRIKKDKMKKKDCEHKSSVKSKCGNKNLDLTSPLSEKNDNLSQLKTSVTENPGIALMDNFNKSEIADKKMHKNMKENSFDSKSTERDGSKRNYLKGGVSDIIQTPVTACGDYICHQKKVALPDVNSESHNKSNILHNQASNLIAGGREYDQGENSTSLTKTKKTDSTKPSKQSTKVNMRKQGVPDSPTLSRRCSLRSGKKNSSPQVSFMPLAFKCTKTAEANTTGEGRKDKDLSNKDKNSPGNAGYIDMEEAKTQSLKKLSVGTSSMTLSDVIKSNKQKTKSDLCKDFKSPRKVDTMKDNELHHKGKKQKNKTDTCIRQSFKTPYDERPQKFYSDDVISQENGSNFKNSDQILQCRNLSNKKESKNTSISSLQPLSHGNSNEQFSRNSSPLAFCNKSNHSKSSSEWDLYIETDKSVRNTEIASPKDHIAETQIDEPFSRHKDGERNIQDNSNIMSSKPKDGGTAENVCFADSASPNFLKLNGTQTSNTVAGSYVFNKKDKDIVQNRLFHDVHVFDKELSGRNFAQRDKKRAHVKDSAVCTNSKATFVNDRTKSKEVKKKVPESSPTITSSIDIKAKVHEYDNVFSGDNLKLSCKGNLRTRNKSLCYTECDSVVESSLSKIKAVSPHLSCKIDTTFDNELTNSDRYSSFPSRLQMEKKIQRSVSKCTESGHGNPGLEWSSRLEKNTKHQKNYNIFRSQEIRTTVTSIPIDSSLDCSISDPYDFDSECQKEGYNSLGLENNSFVTSDKKFRKLSQEYKHLESKRFKRCADHFQQIISNKLKSVNVGFYESAEIRKKGHRSKANLKNISVDQRKISTRSDDCLEKQDTPRNLSSKGQRRYSNNVAAHEGVRYVTHLHGSVHKNDTERQDGGLIFPPLSDSIPSIPECDGTNNEGCQSVYSFDTKSRGTELSWIAKVKASPTKKKKMRGRTYGQQNCGTSEPQDFGDNLHADTMLPSLNEMQKTVKRKLSFERKGKEKRKYNWKSAFEEGSYDSPALKQHSSSFPVSNHDQLKYAFRSTSMLEGEVRADPPSIKGNKSGPSFSPRMNFSALKRKYPDVSSDSVENISYSDSAPEMLTPRKQKLLPKKLFNSAISRSINPITEKNKNSDYFKHVNTEKDWENKIEDSHKMCPDELSFASSSKEKLEILSKPTPKGRNMKSLSYNTPKESKSILKTVAKKTSSHKATSFDLPKDCIEDQNIDHFDIQSTSSGTKTFSQASSYDDERNLSLPLNLQGKDPFNMEEAKAWNEKNYFLFSKYGDLSKDYSSENDNGEEEEEASDHLNKSLHNLTQMESINTHSAGPSESSSTIGTAPEILKSTRNIMKTSFSEIKGRRSQAMKLFDRQFQSVVNKMENFCKETKESEKKSMMLWSQHLQRLKSHRELSKQSLESLKLACNDLLNEMKENHTSQEKVKKSVKSALKKDVNALSMSINKKFNAFSLEAMRRCLQVSIMMS